MIYSESKDENDIKSSINSGAIYRQAFILMTSFDSNVKLSK